MLLRRDRMRGGRCRRGTFPGRGGIGGRLTPEDRCVGRGGVLIQGPL